TWTRCSAGWRGSRSRGDRRMGVTAELHGRGKVRDIYEAGDNLLMVASDRISAFDVVLPTPIPDKGRVLSGLTLFWLEQTRDLVANHLLTAEARDFPPPFDAEPELSGRAMLVRKAQVVPIECVARGYLSGSGWKEYRTNGTVCGIPLPDGLRESDRLPEPIFTPSTKATEGHDQNITIEEAGELVGEGVARRLEELTLTIYQRGAEIARERGI